MRPIDADELYRDICRAYDECGDILEIIEKQPTIEPQKGARMSKSKWFGYTAKFTADAIERKDIEKAFEYLKNIEMTGEMVMRIIGNIPTAKPDIIIEYPDWILDVEGALATAVLSGSKHPLEDALREAAEKNKGE